MLNKNTKLNHFFVDFIDSSDSENNLTPIKHKSSFYQENICFNNPVEDWQKEYSVDEILKLGEDGIFPKKHFKIGKSTRKYLIFHPFINYKNLFSYSCFF